MSIFLIRHGETDGNAQRVLQRPETPLSARGLAQADLLAARLADEPISLILTSDYARAHATAEKLAAATGAPLQVEETLRERNFGDLRGRPYSEVGDIFADGFSPPGGESWERFFERADRSWERVLAALSTAQQHVAVVTHGLICYAYALRQFASPVDEPVSRGFGNTSLTIADAAPPYEVKLLNCCAHLDAATAHDQRSVSGI